MGRMVKESSVHVVPISVCRKISGGPSTEHPLQLHVVGETLHKIRFHHCVFMWALLYLDVRPLGLQALHARQNLLLVPGKSHTHLSQFTDTDVED